MRIVRFIPVTFTALAITALSLVSASAQPVDPKKFFEPNYARTTEFREAKSQNPPTEPQLQGGSQPAFSVKNPFGPTINEPLGRSNSDQTSTPPPYEPLSADRIDVAINFLDQQHFNTVLDTIKQLVTTRRIRFGMIYCLGAPEDGISEEMRNQFLHAGIQIGPYDSVPVPVEVMQSPVWIFASSDGMRIVEGVMNIERYLGPEGAFQEATAAPTVAPTPAPQLKGF
jgi:hypothetical protein